MSFRRLSSHSRGQGLVEFALILPLLAIFLVMAVDAGRLFFGWVALQNASRIGADFASTHADAWGGNFAAGANDRAKYQFLVKQDLQALGCQSAAVPAPNFDLDGDGTSDYTDGALARVDLDCAFVPLTPLAEVFMGQPFLLHSFSDFAINRTYTSGLPPPTNPPPLPSATPGPTPGTCIAPNFIGPPSVRRNNAQGLWTANGFTTTARIPARQRQLPDPFAVPTRAQPGRELRDDRGDGLAHDRTQRAPRPVPRGVRVDSADLPGRPPGHLRWRAPRLCLQHGEQRRAGGGTGSHREPDGSGYSQPGCAACGGTRHSACRRPGRLPEHGDRRTWRTPARTSVGDVRITTCLAVVRVPYVFNGATPVISALVGPINLMGEVRFPVEFSCVDGGGIDCPLGQ